VVTSLFHRVRFTFDRLSEKHGTEKAELSVAVNGQEVRNYLDITLKSDRSHNTLAATLHELDETIPWKSLLPQACALVLQHKRVGDPWRRLNQDALPAPLTYTINPLVFKNKPTVLFGDGGFGKSTFALLCALLVSSGQCIAGISALKGRALFLDWEDDFDVHHRRTHALIAGHPTLKDAHVSYLECKEPLSRLIHSLLRQIYHEGITFVVIDSLMAATGGDASSEAVSKFFDTVRLLGIETLILGHVAKVQVEGQEQTIYGSVFNKNRARMTWEFKKEQEIGENVSTLGLFHRKSNLSRLHHPIGLQVTQTEDGSMIRYEAVDLKEAAELSHSLPLPAQIRNLLEDGIPREAKDIADLTGNKLSTVQRTLTKYKGIKWQMSGGPGQKTVWTAYACKTK